jgi:hypothetical protein
MLHGAALLFGIVVAVARVSFYTFIESAGGANPAFDSESLSWATGMAEAAAIFSTYVAILVVIVCVPIWLLLTKLRLARWWLAAILGFAAPYVYWVFIEGSDAPDWDAATSGLAYGICGAFAGLATWWASPTRRDAVHNEDRSASVAEA